MIDDVQAMAAIEAAKITADATIKSGEMAFNGGMVAAGVALLASVIAGAVGFRQVGILTGQKDIQERLANIEKTKIALDLVERRSGYISIIDDLSNLMIDIAGNVGDHETNIENVAKVADRLEKATLIARYYFDENSADVMNQATTVSGNIKIYFAQGTRGLTADFRNSDAFKNLATQTGELWDAVNMILFGQTKPFLSRLMNDTEASEPLTASEVAKTPQHVNWLRQLSHLSRSPAIKLAELNELAKTPSARLAELNELAKMPSARLAELNELAKSPSAKLAELNELVRGRPTLKDK